MTLVNEVSQTEDLHVARLMGAAFEEIRRALAGDEWQGLRPSHFRVIESVPSQGISITELAQQVRMTKQGCGQFVARLTESGHLRTVADPADRRSRIVRRTPKGTRLIRRVASRIGQVEATWAQRVGADRYAVFRDVLAQVSAGGAD